MSLYTRKTRSFIRPGLIALSGAAGAFAWWLGVFLFSLFNAPDRSQKSVLGSFWFYQALCAVLPAALVWLGLWQLAAGAWLTMALIDAYCFADMRRPVDPTAMLV